MSNPAEVAKTRLQLQGELVKGGGQKIYKNVFDVFGKTWKNEGIKGIQRGLGPAVSPPQTLNNQTLISNLVRVSGECAPTCRVLV